jgi:sugar phosphate isomerase/epimerase
VADSHGVVHEQGRGRAPSRTVPDAPEARIALSTASVYPESTSAAFEIAAGLGYDGVEVMVGMDPVSQDPAALRRLCDYHGLPIIAIHAPCLLITQRVWGSEPWLKLDRAREVAEEVEAGTVVVHPPFRWQRDYARVFERGLARLGEETDVVFSVENMFPWRAGGRVVQAYAPDWDVLDRDYPKVTLDLSHTATSQSDALELLDTLGDRVAHVHLADGSGSAKDEHLIPGRGTQPCAEVLERLAGRGFAGAVVVEVNTRRSPNRELREFELTEALAFARLHFAAPVESGVEWGAPP